MPSDNEITTTDEHSTRHAGFPMRRASDHGKWGKVLVFLFQVTPILIGAATFILGAVGIKIVSTAQQLSDMQREIVKLRYQADTLGFKVSALVQFRCLDGQTSQYELNIAGIACPPWTVNYRANTIAPRPGALMRRDSNP